MEVYKQSKIVATQYLNAILIVFAILFSGFVTSRSLIPGISFPMMSILWLVFCLPLFYQKKILSINSTAFSVILFLLIVLLSGALNFGKQYSNSDVVSLTGSIVMYFILISLMNSHDIVKKIIIINIVVTIPIVLVMSIRSWFFLDSLWLSPYWNNNYALGKNTVGFFTIFCFNYLFSYFIYKKTLLKLIGLIILSLVTFYTVSRGALISWLIVIILTPLFSKNKKTPLLFIGGLVSLFLLLVTIFNFNPLTSFIDVKQRGASSQMGIDFNNSSSYNFIDFNRSDTPGSRYGLSQRASHWLTTWYNFKQKPIFGSGSGSFHRDNGTLAHNDYLTILYEYGLIGLSLFLLVGLLHFYYLFKARFVVPVKYRWIIEACIIQIILLSFTFLTVDSYMIPFTWYILAISFSITNLSKSLS
tara:strand:+ start:1357 stop:2604 length:1248 start_codon:yes stop_codon:yes gene_type:complete